MFKNNREKEQAKKYIIAQCLGNPGYDSIMRMLEDLSPFKISQEESDKIIVRVNQQIEDNFTPEVEMKADQRAFLEDWGVISKEPSTTVKTRPSALDVSKKLVLDWKTDTEYSR